MLNKIKEYSQKYGISISICNWVKKEIWQLDPSIYQIDKESSENWYRCLGYQTQILENV
jgi:hypothetical protein